MKVTLCHDWLTGMRGGERVLEILGDLYPDAAIHSLICNPPSVSDRINAHPIKTSPLNRLPGVHGYYRYLLPAMPLAVRALKTRDSDLVISTSHCVAKSIPVAKPGRHLCYCFTPMRYAWLFHAEYFGGNPVKRALLRPLLAALRAWDRRTASRVDLFVAISHHVRDRIRRFYGRNAEVVYPPADTDYFTPAEHPRAESDLIVSALVPYKRVDLAVEAYNQTGAPLTVIGGGTELTALRAKAGPNITFAGRLSDEDVREALRHCRFLIFPGEEDFGIVPVEAMACGRPVIAFRKGGATETVEDGVSGEFFDEPTPDDLIRAVRRAEAKSWDSAAIRARAEAFSIPRFKAEMQAMVARCKDLSTSC